MLDIEILEEPTLDGEDIVPLSEMKQHLRVTNTLMDNEIRDAIKEAAATLHGFDGALNRMVFPCVLARHFSCFPANNVLRLPYPPVIQVLSVSYLDTDGSSPDAEISPSDYILRTNNMIPEIVMNRLYRGSGPYPYWPTNLADHPRAITVIYRAGYEKYPPALKRMIKFLAGHYLENKEATLNETRMLLVSRKVEYGVDSLMSLLRVSSAQDDWE